MQSFKLKYKTDVQPKNQKFNKIFGVFWLCLGLGQLTTDNNIGFLSIIVGFFNIFPIFGLTPDIYAVIENGYYKRNFWLASKTNLTKAKYAKKFAGDITFVFQHKEIRIDGQMLDDNSLTKLDDFINKNEINLQLIPVR